MQASQWTGQLWWQAVQWPFAYMHLLFRNIQHDTHMLYVCILCVKRSARDIRFEAKCAWQMSRAGLQVMALWHCMLMLKQKHNHVSVLAWPLRKVYSTGWVHTGPYWSRRRCTLGHMPYSSMDLSIYVMLHMQICKRILTCVYHEACLSMSESHNRMILACVHWWIDELWLNRHTTSHVDTFRTSIYILLLE